MNPPNKIFAFESDLTFHIYIACGPFDPNELTDFIDEASHKYVPDKVNLYYSKSDVIDLSETENHIVSRFKCDPSFFSFDEKGSFGAMEHKVKDFLIQGTKKIIELRNPFLLPPPGRSFEKPSKTCESYFIQAANLFVWHAEMSFFALLLIREWGELFDEEINTIYVDTIDLYGLISVACRMRFEDQKNAPIAVSFSSYSGYKEMLKDAKVLHSLMVISATTTHSLLGKIQKNTQWKAIERVVTILDLKPTLRHRDSKVENPIVISHVTPPNASPPAKLLPAVRLAGEKFTMDVDDPKSVVLNGTHHAKCLKYLKLDSLKEMVSCLSGYAEIERDCKPIHIDAKKLFSSETFLKWLKKEIDNYAPASTSHVVCIDGVESEVKPLLSSLFGDRQPPFLTPKDLQKPTPKLEIEGSIIVICPTFTTGTKLLEVSRDLRKHPNHKNIVYFTGIGTPVSREKFKNLKSNLEHQTYQVRSFCNIYTGQQQSLGLSWETEQNFLKENVNEFDGISKLPEKIAEKLAERAIALENGSLDDGNLFYGVKKLEFHDGFKFWEKLVDPYPSKHPSLLLFATFAFVLQNARTDVSLPDKDSLSPLRNRRVLLDPENFFRFNDSLIQVAILRAAFPGELDFSDHAEHSASMFYLIERAVQLKQEAVVYELLLSLATDRLSIKSVELKKVKSVIEQSEMEECKWFSGVDFFKNLNSPESTTKPDSEEVVQ